MKNICLLFQLHQPFRLRNYRFFQVGHQHDYFNSDTNKEIIKKLAEECYLPTNRILRDLVNTFKGRLKLSFSISGTALEQFESFAPEVLESFKDLSRTGCVEFVAETYYYTLSSIRSTREFKSQVNKHRLSIHKLLDYEPQVFKNTGCIFNNEIGRIVSCMGFIGAIIDGNKGIVQGHSPNFIYKCKGRPSLKLILRNTGLSDDINHNFFNKNWQEWPLTVEKSKMWISKMPENENLVFLQLRYEIFGNKNFENKSIINFLKKFPGEFLPECKFISPSEACAHIEPKATLNIQNHSLKSEFDPNLWLWLGNDLQRDAFENLYQLETSIIKSKDENLILDWKRLQAADHFYYMNTIHLDKSRKPDFFSPYDSPYEAYINYSNAINYLRGRLKIKTN